MVVITPARQVPRDIRNRRVDRGIEDSLSGSGGADSHCTHRHHSTYCRRATVGGFLLSVRRFGTAVVVSAWGRSQNEDLALSRRQHSDPVASRAGIVPVDLRSRPAVCECHIDSSTTQCPAGQSCLVPVGLRFAEPGRRSVTSCRGGHPDRQPDRQRTERRLRRDSRFRRSCHVRSPTGTGLHRRHSRHRRAECRLRGGTRIRNDDSRLSSRRP